METMNDEYKISFFKPTTKQAIKNRNLTIWLVSIWAVATFGFQFLLKIIEKPTPEPSYIEFTQVWDNVKSNSASVNELQIFSKSTLMVLGKSSITSNHRQILDKGLSWAVYNLCDSVNKPVLEEKISNFDSIRANLVSVKDESYLNAKSDISIMVGEILNIDPNSVIGKLIPFELSKEYIDFTEENINAFPGIMKLYSVHNQSVLTDIKFLGFPFHYFYTAVFLLILYIGLCWIYCYRTDKMNERLGLEATS